MKVNQPTKAGTASSTPVSPYEPKKAKPCFRFITAGALFDGHDAAINVMRRILQSSGAEVIHLGHNRAAEEIIDAAIQEDAHGIGISSYQGGHNEFFKYVVDLLKIKGRPDIKVFGGGGGVILPEEIKELENYGVAKIFSPEDGRTLGLQGMINEMLKGSDRSLFSENEKEVSKLAEELTSKCSTSSKKSDFFPIIARLITHFENNSSSITDTLRSEFKKSAESSKIPVIGITGTGGAGKSSLTDELILRFKSQFPELNIGIIAVDPTKRKTGGALLGDRIRMNAVSGGKIYFRSLATRGSGKELSEATSDSVNILKSCGFDLVIIETSGIGQGDAEITALSDISLYVMTSEFGAPTQLEKIDMLDLADLIAINKFEKRGSEDALSEVRKLLRRSRKLALDADLTGLPVFPTIASRFNNPGVNKLFNSLVEVLKEKSGFKASDKNLLITGDTKFDPAKVAAIPPSRQSYLRDIASTVRTHHEWAQKQSNLAEKQESLIRAADEIKKDDPEVADKLIKRASTIELDTEAERTLLDYEKISSEYDAGNVTVKIRNKELNFKSKTTTLSGLELPRVALPRFSSVSEKLKFLLLENLPGNFPFTAGVFPFKRTEEEPKRMFAGEGPPERTNKRFHYLCKGEPAKRLSTAFDSVTLYGEDPDERPDIYGKIGESGVSIATLDDMKKLYDGFDLTSPNTSVSMTINGPAPTILAMFFNTAIDQNILKFKNENGREPTPEEFTTIKEQTLQNTRGTVQADILKEDQAQNTCIFSIDFALKLMADVQEYFTQNKVRNFYSVSISGYHIAEAGANPITQLALTLANGFTLVEYYLSRGLDIDEFSPNLSFFFSNGLDPEYAVIGRVARRIWAVAMKNRYAANKRSQKLKYHIQTSGRSLHAQEIEFNDIRTTLQALTAYYDHCNSLHTNAYDEAITTPSEESVRRAMAIQMIISREFGPAKNENSLQGSFLFEELTDLVEKAVLDEFERLDQRGGVLGAMETQYQRNRIQEESLYYETLKHNGKLPIMGVNTFINPYKTNEKNHENLTLARSSEAEKVAQLENLRAFQKRNSDDAQAALEKLKKVTRSDGNIFAELMDTVKVASLGQISQALYEVGGKYRRNL